MIPVFKIIQVGQNLQTITFTNRNTNTHRRVGNTGCCLKIKKVHTNDEVDPHKFGISSGITKSNAFIHFWPQHLSIIGWLSLYGGLKRTCWVYSIFHPVLGVLSEVIFWILRVVEGSHFRCIQFNRILLKGWIHTSIPSE